MNKKIYANAGDSGLEFILGAENEESAPKKGGLTRRINVGNDPSEKNDHGEGHLSSIVGRGGVGKTILALQFLTDLLENANSDFSTNEKQEENWGADRPHTAFYFTLEATPYEIAMQIMQFAWGKKRFSNLLSNYNKTTLLGNSQKQKYTGIDTNATRWVSSGLQVHMIPAPAENLGAVVKHIRQTIAENLNKIGRLVAVVIDPLGGTTLGNNSRAELAQLKWLSESHRTFFFLLTEDYIFKKYKSIEHYSQSIFQLEYTPKLNPPRRIYIQKVRGQRFWPGYHHFEIMKNKGFEIIPALEALSADAHRRLDQVQSKRAKGNFEEGEENKKEFFLKHGFGDSKPLNSIKVREPSVIFLMGPPGTFKQYIATNFATLKKGGKALTPPNSENETKTAGKEFDHCEECCIYISFKADLYTVQRVSGDFSEVVPLYQGHPRTKGPHIHFLDARNPLLTPEKLLGEIRKYVLQKKIFKRAVVWGLRRLNDMPNFSGGKSVQFLEALVTLLTSQGITTLLIDWPELKSSSPLPIVDLSQYILLTRVCRSPHSSVPGIHSLWKTDTNKPLKHVALLRLQRSLEKFNRDLGLRIYRDDIKSDLEPQNHFEWFWNRAGYKWETDPSLVQGDIEDYIEPPEDEHIFKIGNRSKSRPGRYRILYKTSRRQLYLPKGKRILC